MEKAWVSALILGAGQASRMGQTKQLLPWGQTTLLGRVVENVLASQVQETILILGHEAQDILQSLGPKPFELIRTPPERLPLTEKTEEAPTWASRFEAMGSGSVPELHLSSKEESRRLEITPPVTVAGVQELRFLSQEASPDRPFKVLMNPGYPEGLSSSIRLGVSSLDPRAGAVMIVLGDQPLIDPPMIDSLMAAFRASDRGIVAPFYRGRRGHPILLHLKYREAMLSLRGDVGCREILSACPEDLLGIEVDCPGVIQDVDTPEEYRRCHERLAKDWTRRP